MIDYDSPEPTEAQIRRTRLPREDFGLDFHEGLVLAMLQAGAVDGVYRNSMKRLVLATGLPKSDIETILFMLVFQGKIEVKAEGIVLSN